MKNGRRVVLLDFGVAQQSQDCVELTKAGLLSYPAANLHESLLCIYLHATMFCSVCKLYG